MTRARSKRGKSPARRRGGPQLRLGAWVERELVVDLFAGGGGASEGITRALGRHPDIAINHDPLAVAMHEANHPTTKHYCESVFKVSPIDACGGRPVGLLWASPDCTHFSKSKGGKPRSKRIRGLAWVVTRWARDVRPRVIALENVEEFADWGPLGPDNLPDKARAGKTFRAWVRKLESYGYVVEHRILIAADYGAPTTRKRLFVVARCDGAPIQWPAPTHAKDARGSRRWRSAAEVIDWSIPTRSIFGRKKPLAEPTMRRIAVGMWRHVIEAADPFIVPVTHPRDARVHSLDEPLRTVTAANRGELALIAPTLVSHYGASVGRSIEDPAPTVTAGGGGHTALTTPVLFRTDMQSDGRLRGIAAVDDPLRTITTTGGHAVASATLVTTGHGERTGQTPRVPGLEKPLGTVVATAQNHALVTAFLSKHYGSPPDRMRAVGSELDEPAGTVTARDHHGLSVAYLEKMYGSARSGASVRGPVPTVTTGGGRGGGHIALVQALLRRYDRDGRPRDPDAPLDERTALALLGLVWVAGELYQIVDICMRMLAARELFRAQGFRDSYVIAPVCDQVTPAGKRWRGPLIKTEQIAKAGNSVCPPLAEAIVRANLRGREAVAA